MKKIDYEKAHLLLSVAQMAGAHGVSLDALAREAVAELREMNADARENVSARAAVATDKAPMVA